LSVVTFLVDGLVGVVRWWVWCAGECGVLLLCVAGIVVRGGVPDVIFEKAGVDRWSIANSQQADVGGLIGSTCISCIQLLCRGCVLCRRLIVGRCCDSRWSLGVGRGLFVVGVFMGLVVWLLVWLVYCVVGGGWWATATRLPLRCL